MKGVIFGGAYLRREVLGFKIDWASRIVGGKFAVFASFYFVFEGNFPKPPPGDLHLEGRFNGGFFALPDWGGLYLEGLILGILRYLLRVIMGSW